jgi:hypothetical protein
VIQVSRPRLHPSASDGSLWRFNRRLPRTVTALPRMPTLGHVSPSARSLERQRRSHLVSPAIPSALVASMAL